MFGANHVHVLLIILTDLQIWGFGLTAIYYATPWQARLLRIFGLAAIYYARLGRLGFCDIWPDGHLLRHALAGLASAYIWPDGHLYCSRLGNAGLTAFQTGPSRYFHETCGLLSLRLGPV